jgi:hypothetical protein
VLIAVKCTTLRDLTILRNSRVNLLRELAFGLRVSSSVPTVLAPMPFRCLMYCF